MGKVKDYGVKIGDKFNKWTIVGVGEFKKVKDKRSNNGFRLIQSSLCKCECGRSETQLVTNIDLVNDRSKGCMNCSNKKYNTYDLSGNYGVGYTKKGEKFYFDLEDYEKIKDHCWHMHWDTHNGYLRTCLDSTEKKNVYEFMHRLVMDYRSSDEVIDHINNRTFDNRKENLRKVSRSVNAMNTKSRSNTKYISGVTFNKIEKKFKSCIKVDKKQINLGTYKNLEDAIKARLEAEFKYFDITTAPNSNLFEKYGVGCNE